MHERLRILFAAALLLLPVVVFPAVSGTKSAHLPYDLVIEVDYGRRPVSSGVLEELGFAVRNALERAGCFRSVRREAPNQPGADDLLLRLTVEDYEDRTDSRFSINDQADPSVDRRQLTTVELRAELSVALRTLAEDLPVRTKRFHQRNSWTPTHFEDPREYAKDRMIETIATRVRSLACKGSPAKWAKQLAQARAAAGTPADPSR